MLKLLIIAYETEQIREMISGLVESGFICSVVPSDENAVEQVTEQAPDLVLIAMEGLSDFSWERHLTYGVKQAGRIPVVALLSVEALGILDSAITIDDFLVEPWDAIEAAVRIKRVLRRTSNIDNGELIRCGDLVIDLAQCEVCLNEQLIPLTFKEYELLRFLASNKGRVFSRDALLNKVWGYDYYGGDRTIDVHIRRLRSKIDDPTHTFIETVRNIGYKFRES